MWSSLGSGLLLFFLDNLSCVDEMKSQYKKSLKSVYKALIPSVLAFKTSFPEILNTHWLLIGIFMPLEREGKECGLLSTVLKGQTVMHWDTYLYGHHEDSHTVKDVLRLG